MVRSARPSDLVWFAGAVACVAGAAAPALSQDTQVIEVIGQAEPQCNLGAAEQGSGDQLNMVATAGSVFSVSELTDSQTLSSRAAIITLDVPAMCNSIHRVALASDNNGLWLQNPTLATAGFASAVPYAADLVWSEQTYRLNADAESRGSVEESLIIGQPATGAIQIEFSIVAGASNAGFGAPLLAGDYVDVLRVIVEPQ